MTMKIIPVNDRLSVATQPELSDFAQFAADGFTSVINNRPDGEDVGQPTAAEEQAAAADAGLPYVSIPISGGVISEADVRAFQKAVADSSGPALAHCRSGTRSLTLFAIGEVLDGRMKADELRDFGAQRGIDLRGAESWLSQNRAG
jgi:uncharacterized protein (TIGR01244 family)